MASLSRIRLRYYTDAEIKDLAVVKVLHASTYDRGVPKTDGINDARMGLIDHTVRCPTCFKANCDQHFGYIELAKPVYRLGSINTVLMVLRSVCRECARPKFGNFGPADGPDGFIDISEALKTQEPSRDKLRTISEACRNKHICQWCKAPQPSYTKRARTFIDATYRTKDLSSDFVKNRGPEYLQFLKARFMPDDAASILFGLSSEARYAIGLDRADSLMCRLQIVPPPIIRPSNFVGESKVRSENDLTCALQDVVRANLELTSILDTPKIETTDVERSYDKLQVMVSGIVNHAIKRSAAQSGLLPLVAATSKRKIIDLKTRLNGKKARVRGNLNGKRVDQSGRTVISGDASHDIDELGVPSVMMNKLTFPEQVNNLNIQRLAQCILIGAYANNGALAVRPPSHSLDHVIWLPILDLDSRIDLAAQIKPGWTVERHLVNGDWVLFNRQPSLWKASMMAFRCYRTSGLTARLPLPVTRAFNADFDGDEMNIHSLQGYEAVAEAQELMAVPHQIVTPQSNSIIIGLVQDSLVGAWRLTAQDCFFDKNCAIDLLTAINYDTPGRNGSVKNDLAEQKYKDLSGPRPEVFRDLWLPEPAIIKSSKGPMWTGKQLASLIVPTSLNITRNINAPLDDLTGPSGLVIKNGDILAGRLSKTYLGAANTGLVHAIWRLYGPGGSHKFISDAQRLFVKHLSYDGPTQSIVDCLMGSEELTLKILSKHLGRSDAILGLTLPQEVKESKSSTILQETLRSVGSSVLANVRPESALANCVNSGSKGNVMNIAQIGGCVGQQTVYGRRIPIRDTRLGPRTLVYYSPGDLRAEARGFISNSYMSGLSPAEFFEHQMAGREGIVATAVNTSESGYNQRRMIKGQESQCIGYDATVRVSSNIIIQSFYGGDDLDGSRLEKIKLHWLFKPETILSKDILQLPVVIKALHAARKHAIWRANVFKDLDLTFPCGIALGPIIGTSDKPRSEKTLQGAMRPPIQKLLEFAKKIYTLHKHEHSSTTTFFNISIAVAVLQACEFIDELNTSNIDKLVELYSKALVAAGEGVGALGASSIGEPSMQMTLNVFHYSGIADKNVTITGLPRFKQLINGVDTYETSNMTAEVDSYENIHSALQTSRVMLSDVCFHASTDQKTNYGGNFMLFGSQRGPFYTKFGTLDWSYNSNVHVIKLGLDWSKCARKCIDSATIVKALRDTFSYDAIIIGPPHWSKKAIEIHVAPWISASSIGPICEGLFAQQQVRGIDYIKNCICFQETRWSDNGQTESRHVVETEGSNILDLARCKFIKSGTIRSTNVLEVSKVFGISTGISTLQAELHKVLSFDNSYIDPRHTWLLADTMGRSGFLAAMNRHHMETLGSSLLQRASFEQSLDVFEEGAAFGRSDPLAGATERIITGQPVCIGTGLVGIVPNNTSRTEPEFLVAPMASKSAAKSATAATTIVRPMNFTKEFDPSCFSAKFTDYDKTIQDEFFGLIASQFRSSAAQYRIMPVMTITTTMNETTYKTTLARCWQYKNWTSTESTEMVTEVFWPMDSGDTGLTRVIAGSDAWSKSWSLKIFKKDAVGRIKCEIMSKKKMEPQEVPFGTSPTKVIMRQQTVFNKGPFSLTLGRQWEAATNVEVEDLVLKTRGTMVSILETIEPDTILQNRCTDEQLANALFARIP